MGINREVWDRVRTEETDRVRQRRERLRNSHWQEDVPEGEVGLALSGGGIRSATFSLGLMKSLSKAKLIDRVDYLSTVSGGGYAGGFYCSLFVPEALRGSGPPGEGVEEKIEARFQELGADVLGSDRGREALANLRQGGHYLAPNGTSDALFAAVIAIRNWFAMALITGLGLLAIFLSLNLFVDLLQNPIDRFMSEQGISIVPPGPAGFWLVILTFLAFWPVSCAWAYWFARSGYVPISRMWRPFSMQTLVAASLAGLALFIWPTPWIGWHRLLRMGIAVTAALSLFIYIMAEIDSYIGEKIARADGAANRAEAFAQEDTVRHTLSRWLFRGVFLLLGASLFAGIHLLSNPHIAGSDLEVLHLSIIALLFLLIFAIVVASRMILQRSSVDGEGSWLMSSALLKSRRVLSLAAGLTLLLLYLKFWAAVASGTAEHVRSLGENRDAAIHVWERLPYLIADTFQAVGIDVKAIEDQSALVLFVVTVCVGAIAYFLGNVDAMLNRSSLAAFYSGRLRSAYLGATNGDRWKSRITKKAAVAALAGGRSAAAPGTADETGAGADGEEPAAATDRSTAAAGTTPAPAVDPASGSGAAGPADAQGAADAAAVDREDPRDEITLNSYYHPRLMAPIHLINVTINETTSRSSRVIQRDRKGKSMTVAPSGYLYPPGSPSGGIAIVERADGEELPLSAWMAISGAAFSAGAGHHTTLGNAMLASLTNMRLGYWWESERRKFHRLLRSPNRLVQFYLLRELRADYEGTGDSRWYLSDGGHYENTGVYELVRRRIPFIVASDNGADPRYEFADLVNLIRKLRIDFDAEVEFVDRDEIDALFGRTPLADVFGTLDQIRNRGEQARRAERNPNVRQPKAGPYATLARIRYLSPEDQIRGADGKLLEDDDGRPVRTPDSTLLLIKPRITGNELPDLVQYRETNAAFPQQPTTNQFFDEAQWESYYRLGQLIGERIFDYTRYAKAAAAPPWKPWEFVPLPREPLYGETQLSLAMR